MANIKQIKLYTVDHDYGINPNPFFGYCTLGHCKRTIRKSVAKSVLKKNSDGNAEELGIWLVGIASGNNRKYKPDCGGKILYAMQVTQVLTYAEYWKDERFIQKHVDDWSSFAYNPNNADFRNCNDNLKADSKIDCNGKTIKGQDEYVLISDNFIYWGDSCNKDFGHIFYGSKTGGGRYSINYPGKAKYDEGMRSLINFINVEFGDAKHADILGKPIMSADNFNLEEARKAGKNENNTFTKRV